MRIKLSSLLDRLSERESATPLRTLLEQDRFNLAAEQLQRLASDRSYGDLRIRQVLRLLHSLCLALHQCRLEVEWHRWATEMVEQRKRDLQESLLALLALSNDLMLSAKAESANANLYPLRDLSRLRGDNEGVPVNAEVPASFISAQPGHRLAVYTLGYFEVYVDDLRAVKFPNRKSLGLFRYLLVHRRPIHREQLIELLWADSDPELARNRLNNTLYSVREALRQGEDKVFPYVVYENEQYRLNPELEIWTDYESFQSCCEDGRTFSQYGDSARMLHAYQGAVSLYQGAFMPDAPYEDWIESERTHHQNEYLMALDALSQHYLETDDITACVSTCQKLLQVDACHEDAHRRLMRCYARLGQSYLALRQYQRCARILQEGLNAEPMAETTQLYAQIRAGIIT